jgi:hypothetical protein
MTEAAMPRSGYPGVAWSRARRQWQAKVKVRGKQHYLGLFDNPHEAHLACEAARAQLAANPDAPVERTGVRYKASKTDMEARLDAILAIIDEIKPCGVRQVFYQTVARGLLDKTESDYEKVQRAIVRLRRDELMPYGWIVDGTRWMHKRTTFSSLDQAVRRAKDTYRRAVWDDQPVRVEIWLEKQGLVGVIFEVTDEFDVPLYVSRGFSSLTYLAEAAEDIEACDKPTYIYHLGDHDPWGHKAGEAIERELRRLAPHAEIHFERMAVTVEQIRDWSLPTRPTKGTESAHRATTRGAKGVATLAAKFETEYGRGSVELDALHPESLRGLVRDAVERHVDFRQLDVLRTVEAEERRVLERFISNWRKR